MTTPTTYRIAVSGIRLEEKIPHGSPLWTRFNASFYNESVSAHRLLELIYDGYSITTQHNPRWRTADNFVCGQTIGLDFDTEDEASTLSTLMNDPFIEKFGGLLHTTMSHTPDKPRARVVFLLDTPIMQAANYALAAAALLWAFGTADRSCKDAARFWYGSAGCEFEFLDNELPLSVVKTTIKNYQAVGKTRQVSPTPPRYYPPTSQKKIAEALALIPPWQIDYDEWVGVLMGLHTELGDAGLPLAESWADGKDGEVAKKWRTFKENGNTSGAVTIASVFALAKRNG